MTVLHHDLSTLSPDARGGVIAIGNFDGVHLGHRALIKKAHMIANNEDSLLGVLTFEPHPRQFFQPHGEPFRLTLLPMKQRLMKSMGVDHLFAVPFDKTLSQLSAQEFIDQILVQKLSARHIVVGADFSFGSGRTGNVDLLEDAAEEGGDFALTVMPKIADANEEVYSSSAIRELLRHGRIAEANKKLGWTWQMEGPVVHGEKRGRELGFPTANQNIDDYARIPFGVYAVRVLLEGERDFRHGVANIGIRPMFESKKPLLETFIFDFSQEIYGKILRVEPLVHLRPEMKFDGKGALIAQMKEDCIAAKAVLKSLLKE